jgi:hypothetical protein
MHSLTTLLGFWGALLVEFHSTKSNVALGPLIVSLNIYSFPSPFPRLAGLRLRETAPHRVTGFAAVLIYFIFS